MIVGCFGLALQIHDLHAYLLQIWRGLCGGRNESRDEQSRNRNGDPANSICLLLHKLSARFFNLHSWPVFGRFCEQLRSQKGNRLMSIRPERP
jgi:hypothetical protein